nr:hypothetical protein Iba_chr15bCG7640 [Ipomoea batatas]
MVKEEWMVSRCLRSSSTYCFSWLYLLVTSWKRRQPFYTLSQTVEAHSSCLESEPQYPSAYMLYPHMSWHKEPQLCTLQV